jgi:hypothetical protein
MASIRVPGMRGWGNRIYRYQAPVDYLRLTGEVCGRLFLWQIWGL